MSDLDQRGLLPTWAVALCALIVPLLLAMAFLSVMDYANPPGRGELKPGEGQMIADTNNGIVLVHAIAQLGFVILGTLFLPRTTRARVIFLVISIPFCGLVFLVTLVGLIAP